MPNIPGLRSPYIKVGRLVYFGRMLDKVRLHAAAKLPPDFVQNLGIAFDGRCCNFLRVPYEELKARTLKESALETKPVMTMFDYLDFDEGRDPSVGQDWLK